MFKAPEPIVLDDSPRRTKQRKPSVYVISDESKMETSVLDMFADHSLSGYYITWFTFDKLRFQDPLVESSYNLYV